MGAARFESSPLDDLFVAGAQHVELSADERANRSWSSELTTPPASDRPIGRWLVWAVILIILAGASSFLQNEPERTGHGTELRLFVAVPSDGTPNYSLADAASHEATLAVDWLESQTGQQLRGDVDFGYVTDLRATEADLRGDAHYAYLEVLTEVMASGTDRTIFPIIMADVRTELLDHGPQTCGLGGPTGIVIFLGNCRGFEPTRFSSWGSHASHTVAHELVHGMGAVWDCAPNSTGTGHVYDDPTDVLYEGPTRRSANDPVVLDSGRNDYWGHGIPECPDIMDSPLWESG